MSYIRSIILSLVLLISACASQNGTNGIGNSGNFDQLEAAKTRISLGLTYLKNGNYSQAKFNLDKALQYAPRLADAHYSMAYYYQVVGENALAEAAYQEALDRAPNNPDIANTYGAFLCQQGKYETAKSYFLEAVNSNNYVSTAETYENLALCSQSQGQVGDAITYLSQAIKHQPNRGKSLFLLAQLQASEGLWLEAKESLRRYEKSARVSAETLWLAEKIEVALGNEQIARGYGDMLIRMYPNHPNTKAYIAKRTKKTPVQKPPTKVVQEVAVKPQTEKQPPAPVTATEPEETAAEPAPETAAEPEQTAEVAPEPVPATPAEPEQTAEVAADPAPETAAEPEQTPEVNPEPAKENPAPPVVTEPVETQEQVETAEIDQVADGQVESGDPSHYHIVQRHENLYRISLQYNIRMEKLVEWNQLKDASAISAGKRLIIVDPQTIE